MICIAMNQTINGGRRMGVSVIGDDAQRIYEDTSLTFSIWSALRIDGHTPSRRQCVDKLTLT